MQSNGMKRSLFSLLGVKTGGGGREGVFHRHPVKREGQAGGAASQRA